MLTLFGAGIGRGISIGRAYILGNSEVDIPHYRVPEKKVRSEVTRFNRAIEQAHQQYRETLATLPKTAPRESAAFIEAHIMMLKDPLLVKESINIIRQQGVNAEYALQQQTNNLVAVFEDMQDAYLRDKKSDVQHIGNRVMRNLLGIVSHNIEELDSSDLRDRIVVGRDVSPAEAMYLTKRHVVAFVTDLGSQISHTAIVARSMKLPAVVGLHGRTRYIQEDDLLIIDGMRGIVVIDPGKQVLKEYKALQSRIRRREAELISLTQRASKTLDGEKISLLANIESAQELKQVRKSNAHGIGLFRTEYLFMNRATAPTEDEQFQAYKAIVSRLDKPVVIRTLDIGGDKRLDFSYPKKSSSESPLGLRAVRLCLHNIELFKPQLNAILRASKYGRVALLIPMLSNIEELNQVLDLIRQTKYELRQRGIEYDKRIKVGGMIEVPAAALMADMFASKLDFLSIGTNDLIQYTLAIDRVDDAVNYLYDPIHPAVLKLIKDIIRAGTRANIPVTLCGEMAGNVRFTRTLLGLGLRHFSMDANYLLDVKERILAADTQILEKQVKKLLASGEPLAAKSVLKVINEGKHR